MIRVRCAPYPSGLAFTTARRPAVVALITDPQQQLRRRLEGLQRRYGLTHAEAKLTMALLTSGNRKDAAGLRGVSVSTARSQLTSIFDKTGVRRQTDLVRLLMTDRED